MEYVFLAVFVILAGLYLADRKGWNATAKRLTKIVRANIESAKPVQKLESSSKKAIADKEKDSWTAEFTGKELDDNKVHEIVRTWFTKDTTTTSSVIVWYRWKCKCGAKDGHLWLDRAQEKSMVHVREGNKAEELLKRNGGTHAW